MILDDIKTWPGKVAVNDVVYSDVASAIKNALETHEKISSVKLLVRNDENVVQSGLETPEVIRDYTKYRISVRQYMTRMSSSDFDFMKKWNNDIPMPLMTMVGYKLKETPGMVRMMLWGDVTGEKTEYCLKCGKRITNPVSKYFGMGPECGGHNYVNPFSSEEELRLAVENYRKTVLSKITWTGWIIKSAITEEEIIENGKG